MKFRTLAFTVFTACAFVALPAMAESTDKDNEKAKSVKDKVLGSFYGHTEIHQLADEMNTAPGLTGPDIAHAGHAPVDEDEYADLAKEREAAEKAHIEHAHEHE